LTPRPQLDTTERKVMPASGTITTATSQSMIAAKASQRQRPSGTSRARTALPRTVA
jgi:hypothetical protein